MEGNKIKTKGFPVRRGGNGGSDTFEHLSEKGKGLQGEG